MIEGVGIIERVDVWRENVRVGEGESGDEREGREGTERE